MFLIASRIRVRLAAQFALARQVWELSGHRRSRSLLLLTEARAASRIVGARERNKRHGAELIPHITAHGRAFNE
jgi:hypothetical protein